MSTAKILFIVCVSLCVLLPGSEAWRRRRSAPPPPPGKLEVARVAVSIEFRVQSPSVRLSSRTAPFFCQEATGFQSHMQGELAMLDTSKFHVCDPLQVSHWCATNRTFSSEFKLHSSHVRPWRGVDRSTWFFDRVPLRAYRCSTNKCACAWSRQLCVMQPPAGLRWYIAKVKGAMERRTNRSERLSKRQANLSLLSMRDRTLSSIFDPKEKTRLQSEDKVWKAQYRKPFN